MKNLCDTCTKHPAECDAEDIKWGIDFDRSLIGAEADAVVECDAYNESIPKKEEQNVPKS